MNGSHTYCYHDIVLCVKTTSKVVETTTFNLGTQPVLCLHFHLWLLFALPAFPAPTPLLHPLVLLLLLLHSHLQSSLGHLPPGYVAVV